MTRHVPVLAVLGALAGSAIVRAAAAESACTWTSITPCTFGNYSNVAHVYTTGSLGFHCPEHDTPVTITLDSNFADVASGCTTGACRRIPTAGDSLSYVVYKDAARTQYFGSDASGQIVLTSPNVDNQVPVYCDLFPGANPAADQVGYRVTETAHLVAGTTNLASTLEVSTVVNGTCSVTVSSELAFGAYEPVVTNRSAPLDGVATASITCTNEEPYTVTLGQGNHVGNGSTDAAPMRQMMSGGHPLAYMLYRDPGRTAPWGNTPDTGVVGMGTGTAQTVTAYGRIPAGQQEEAGSYADVVLMTVTF